MATIKIRVDERFFNHQKRLSEGFEDLPEDFNAYDYSGGNFDDAWEGGDAHATKR